MTDPVISRAIQTGNLDYFLNCLKSEHSKTSLMNYSHAKSGDTLVHIVSRMGQTQILSVLWEHGFALEVDNFDGKRPLHEAAQSGHYDCVRFLLEAGVKVDALKRADW